LGKWCLSKIEGPKDREVVVRENVTRESWFRYDGLEGANTARGGSNAQSISSVISTQKDHKLLGGERGFYGGGVRGGGDSTRKKNTKKKTRSVVVGVRDVSPSKGGGDYGNEPLQRNVEPKKETGGASSQWKRGKGGGIPQPAEGVRRELPNDGVISMILVRKQALKRGRGRFTGAAAL